MTLRFSSSWLPDRFGGLATPRAVIFVPRLPAWDPPAAPFVVDTEAIRYPVPAARPDGEPAAQAWRALLREPGERRMVRLGDFKAQLLPQLAHPERLRDVHLLPCLVQVYEVTATQRIDALAAAIAVSAERRTALQRLTAAAGRRLGLDRWVHPQPGAGTPARGWLAPGARVFRLMLEDDPTEAAERSHPAAVEARGPRTDIPAEQVRAWEFVRSREEVLGEMAAAAVLAHPLSRVWRWLRKAVGLRGALRAWLGRCTGRSADDQLWAVRPPKGALDHPRVREWAAATLERAGYDPHRMLVEWEIFWRRKGV
jgi:hypothetical protein